MSSDEVKLETDAEDIDSSFVRVPMQSAARCGGGCLPQWESIELVFPAQPILPGDPQDVTPVVLSPRPPDRIGGVRGLLDGGARDTDGALRWRIDVLREALLAARRLALGRRRRRRRGLVRASWTLQTSKATTEVSHQLRPGGRMHRRGDRGREERRHLLSALGESIPESIGVAVLRGQGEPPGGAQGVKVTHRKLQDIRLLQLGHVLTLGLQRGHHQVLQLVQAAVDAGASFTLQHWFHHLAVLISARYRLLVLHAADRRVAGVRRHTGITLCIVVYHSSQNKGVLESGREEVLDYRHLRPSFRVHRLCCQIR